MMKQLGIYFIAIGFAKLAFTFIAKNKQKV